MEVAKPNPADLSVTRIVCRYSNQSGAQIDNLNFQAAVPKYLKLDMFPPSNAIVPPFSQGAVTQEMRLTNSQQGQKNIMLKLKIGYKHGEVVVSDFVVLYAQWGRALIHPCYVDGRNHTSVQLPASVLIE
jgi:hypothetical protein